MAPGSPPVFPPLMQAVQWADPSLAANVSTAHGVQSWFAPTESEYEPASQGPHSMSLVLHPV